MLIDAVSPDASGTTHTTSIKLNPRATWVLLFSAQNPDYQQKDLLCAIGLKSRVSEALNRNRKPIHEMILSLIAEPSILVDILVKEY